VLVLLSVPSIFTATTFLDLEYTTTATTLISPGLQLLPEAPCLVLFVEVEQAVQQIAV
jgi:hypothetical protein